MRTKAWRRFRPGNCDPGDDHEGANDVVQDVREDENDDADGGGDQPNYPTVDGRQAKLKHRLTFPIERELSARPYKGPYADDDNSQSVK